MLTLGGVVVCESWASVRVLETSHPPTYYLPRVDFAAGSLSETAGSSYCEWKGTASYLDVIGAEHIAARAGWYYPQPSQGYSALIDLVAVYPAAMDACTVDGERVEPQAGGFYGGWVTSRVAGPFKGAPGSRFW